MGVYMCSAWEKFDCVFVCMCVCACMYVCVCACMHMCNYSIHCVLTATIFSHLQPLTHVMARHIVTSFKPSKPVLLALSLQDTSRETVFALLPIIQSCVSKAQRGTSAQPIKEEAQVK